MKVLVTGSNGFLGSTLVERLLVHGFEKPRCMVRAGSNRSKLEAVQARYLLVSFNDEGALTTDELQALLEPHGEVHRVDVGHPRYVGARIGIYNPGGEKVGTVGHLRNTECLYLVRCR